MEIKSFIKDSAEKERKTHYISNIMMTAVLGLIIIFTFCFGVKVNIGSAVFDDGSDAFVRQNIFQVVDLALNTDMSREEAVKYVEEVNEMLESEYGILGFEVMMASKEKNPAPAHQNLHQFGTLVQQLGKNAHKINLLKYKFAYSVAIENKNSLEHKQSYDSHRIFSIAGQLILVSVTQLAVLIIAAVMLAFAIIALIKKHNNGKMRFAFILLLICAAMNIILFSGTSFFFMNWAGYLVSILTLLGAIMLSLIRHALMDKRDFSLTMLIHNGVLLLGAIIALVFYLSPIFKFTNDVGTSASFGWSYMFDYCLTTMASMGAVMSYTLSYIIAILLFLIPAALFIILFLTSFARFMAADYQHNEKRIFLIITLAISSIIFLLFGIFSSNGTLRITDLYIDVKLNILPIIMNLLIIGGMIAFEIFYKVKPVKKELLIR